MKRLYIAGLLMAAVLALSAMAASSASATLALPCWKVDTAGEGLYSDVHCSKDVGSGGEYVRGTLVLQNSLSLGCLQVSPAKTGHYDDNKCTEHLATANGNFEKVTYNTHCLHVLLNDTGRFSDSNCTSTSGLLQYDLAVVPASLALQVGRSLCLFTDSVVSSFGLFKTELGCGESTESEAAGGVVTKFKTGCTMETPIQGQGSSLQKIAQQNVWIPKSGGCGVTYEPSGSAKGLLAFGLNKHVKPFEEFKDDFAGTDDAPSGSCSTGQLKELEEAAKGVCGSAPQDLVIPVAQAAIAVIVNPPAECLITAITNTDLERAFNGLLALWSEFSTKTEDSANACKKHITRIVRKDGSGTTYQFKHYLFEINPNPLEGSKGSGTSNRTWAELQEEETKNLEWPGTSVSLSLSLLLHAKNSGGGGEAEEVLKEEQLTNKEGTIGYANLGDARAKFNHEEGNRYHWLKVENEPKAGEHTLVLPGKGESESSLTATQANCEETSYSGTIPAAEPDGDWSGVYGGHPGSGTTKNKFYPICTLTWDIALRDYPLTGALTSEEGLTTREYLEYVVSKTEGQAEIAEKHDYDKLPAAVLTVAEKTASLIERLA